MNTWEQASVEAFAIDADKIVSVNGYVSLEVPGLAVIPWFSVEDGRVIPNTESYQVIHIGSGARIVWHESYPYHRHFTLQQAQRIAGELT